MEREAETIQEAVAAPPQDGVSRTASADETAAAEPASLHDRIIAALRTVYDPEIPVNVYDLGLIYRIDLDGAGKLEIDMTLTAPGCPVAGEMMGSVQNAARSVEGISDVKVTLVFDPPWDKERMSEEVQMELGLI